MTAACRDTMKASSPASSLWILTGSAPGLGRKVVADAPCGTESDLCVSVVLWPDSTGSFARHLVSLEEGTLRAVPNPASGFPPGGDS
jgi:hypothetical protein